VSYVAGIETSFSGTQTAEQEAVATWPIRKTQPRIVRRGTVKHPVLIDLYVTNRLSKPSRPGRYRFLF